MESQGCVAMESQIRGQREGWITHCLSASNTNSMVGGSCCRVIEGLQVTDGITLPQQKD